MSTQEEQKRQQEMQLQKQQAAKLKGFFSSENVKAKFTELLGKKAPGFITSVLQVVSSNTLLQKADINSVYNAAAMAATLDLPVTNSLGFSWIVPYKGKAQFQIGWRGFVQLAQRTAQYRHINAIAVYESQFNGWLPFKEKLLLNEEVPPSGKIVGYAARFELMDGFEKTDFWFREQVESHGKQYSQSYGDSRSAWATNFDAMAKKTVLKNVLSKWGPMSIEMQRAIEVDQAVIEDLDSNQFSYVDNADTAKTEYRKEVERVLFIMADLKTKKERKEFVDKLNPSDFTNEEAEVIWAAIGED